jgi:octopine/nopaline transport system permease protein
MDWAFMLDCSEQLLKGLPLTLRLAFFACLAGFALAWLLCALRLSGRRWLDYPARALIEVLRGTPLLVQLFIIYYGLGQFAWLRESFAWAYLREAYWCALLALTLNTAAYTCEILRGGISTVAAGQREAAAALALSRWQVWWHVTWPLAWRQMLPAYGNEIILMVKATSLASIVTLMEVTGIAARLVSQSYRPVEVFVCAGALYLLISFVITRLVMWLERCLHPDRRVSADAL